MTEIWTASLDKRRIAALFFAGMLVFWISAMVAEKTGFANIFMPSLDRFADYIKVVYALPVKPVVTGLPVGTIAEFYDRSPDYRRSGIGISHLPPLSMLAIVLSSKLFAIANPMLVYLTLALVWVLGLIAILQHYAGRLWAYISLISYPALFMLDRGNLFAGFCALAVITALLRQRADWAAAILLAIAFNIRPNSAALALPLILTARTINWRFSLKLSALTFITFGFAYGAVNILYPAYTIDAFLRGLALYSKFAVTEAQGVPFGSSAFGALFVVNEPSWIAPLISSLFILIAGCVLRYLKLIGYGDFVFICSVTTALGSVVFGDYHLLIFIAPMLLSNRPEALAGSILLLAPKGYGFIHGATFQVIANPLLMLVVSVWLLVSSTIALKQRVLATTKRSERQTLPIVDEPAG